jgi:micrococcal nuclease
MSTVIPAASVAPTHGAVGTVARTNTPTPTGTLTPRPTPSATGPAFGAASCVPSNTKIETGEVVRVIDGDTIEVRIGGEPYRVRYIGMDTPEVGDPFGTEATARNRELVWGQSVTLVKDVSETDRYGRLLRYVFVADTFVNYELVVQGYALTSTYPPDVACADTFVDAQRAAVAAGSGLWAAGAGSLGQGSATAPPFGNCDQSYPTVCIPPPPPDLDCSDIPYRRLRVLAPDPHRFDGDHDGVGCEGA